MYRAADASQFRARVRRNLRQAGVDRVLLRMLLHEALHQTVLERVKRDRGEAAARRQRLQTAVERGLQLRELVVHVDADRLERARRRMLAGLARLHGARDELGELTGALERSLAPRRDDVARDPLCELLFAVFADHASELVLRRAREEISSAGTVLRVHAHVEGPIL